MPIFTAQRRQEQTEHSNDHAATPGEFEVPSIRSAAGECADKEDQKGLHATDPGDCRGRFMEFGCVVTLKNAKRVYVAPCVDEDEMGEDDMGPGSDTAVWRGADELAGFSGAD